MSDADKPEGVLERLIAEGWHPASEPPDTDRIVQVAWDDGSTSPSALSFYDCKATIPATDKKYWWACPNLDLVPNVLAWRELSALEESEEHEQDMRDAGREHLLASTWEEK